MSRELLWLVEDHSPQTQICLVVERKKKRENENKIF